MKSISKIRRGSSLATALLLFLLCTLASWTVIRSVSSSVSRAAAIREYERQYVSATSAARLICDSMSDLEHFNVLTLSCLQYANGTGDILTIIMETDNLPPAVCRVIFDDEYNLYATIETDSVMLRLTMPATVPGRIGWSRDDALIERIEEKKAENDP